MTEQGPNQTSQNSGQGWAAAGIICGVLAFLIAPILIGPLGVVFGVVGYRRGSTRLGIAAIVVSVIGLVVGIAIALIAAFSAGNPNLS